MKKLFNVIRRNIFYISLIAGMVALVGLVALYNVKTQSEDEIVVSTEEDEVAENNEDITATEEIEETLGGASNTEEASTATADKTEEADSETDDNETGSTDEADEMENAVEEVVLDYDGTADLIWPLSGNIIIPFSMDTTVYFETLNQYKCNPGIVIEAQEGDEVVAAYKCQITEITSDEEYGNIVRASLGNGYEIMYGQLKDIYVSVGQVVESGTTIATVAAPTRYYTEEGTNLYFEITKDGTPVDASSVIG